MRFERSKKPLFETKVLAVSLESSWPIMESAILSGRSAIRPPSEPVRIWLRRS